MSKSRTSSNSSDRRRRIVVLTAPSGSGKTSIARRLLERIPELSFSVSATTRRRRSHERDGVDYHFVSLSEFDRLKRAGDLLEYEEVYPGRFYGTLRSEVERSAQAGPVLLDVEVKGAANVKRAFPEESFVVFVSPPSMDELERRLRARGSEDDDSFRERMERARHEITYVDSFDAVVINDDLERAANETLELVRSFLQAPSPEGGSARPAGAPSAEIREDPKST